MVPETCVPTCTSSTGCTVPLAATPSTTSPRSTFAVRYFTCAAGEPLRRKNHHTAPPATARTTRTTIVFFIGLPSRGNRRDADRAEEAGLRDLEVRLRLDGVRAGLRERLRRVGELDRRRLARLEAALREVERVGGALDGDARQLDPAGRV